MIEISIIIPIYNAEKYLESLMQEIQEQTLKNFEVILINDGSIDKSKEICEEIAKNATYVRILNQENQGPSVARNNGIKIAKGKYIMFLDADDNIPNNMLQLLYDSVSTKQADLVIAEYNVSVLKNNNLKSNVRVKTKLNDLNGKNEIIKGIISENTTPIFNYLWNKLYVKDIIVKNHLEFEPTLRYAEDLLFNLNYLRYVNKINIVHESVYQYNKRISANSLSNKFRSDVYENSIQIIEWWKKLLLYYELDEKQIEQNLNKQYLNRVDIALKKITPYIGNKNNNISEVINEICSNPDIKKAYLMTKPKKMNQKIIKVCIVYKHQVLLKTYLYFKKIIYKLKGAL